MITKKIQDTEPINADEGTEIRQIFHPHNTLDGIRYSLAPVSYTHLTLPTKA